MLFGDVHTTGARSEHHPSLRRCNIIETGFCCFLRLAIIVTARTKHLSHSKVTACVLSALAAPHHDRVNSNPRFARLPLQAAYLKLLFLTTSH